MDSMEFWTIMIVILIPITVGTFFGKIWGYITAGLIIFYILSVEYGLKGAIHRIVFFGIALIAILVIYSVHLAIAENKKDKERQATVAHNVNQIIKSAGFKSQEELCTYKGEAAFTTTITVTPEQYWQIIQNQLKDLDRTLNNAKLNTNGLTFLTRIAKALKTLTASLNQINQSTSVKLSVPDHSPINPELSLGLQRVLKQLMISSRGRVGEQAVRNAVAFQNGQTKMMINLNVPFNYGVDNHSKRNSNQMDLVLINEAGIFIIEIKNYNFPYLHLNDSGVIEFSQDGKNWRKATENVVDQMSKHQFAIKSLLPGDIDVEPTPILVSANENAQVSSDVENVNIYKPKAFYPAVINPRPHVLSPEQVNHIYETLQAARVNEQTFTFPVFTDDFISSLRNVGRYAIAIAELASLVKGEANKNQTTG